MPAEHTTPPGERQPKSTRRKVKASEAMMRWICVGRLGTSSVTALISRPLNTPEASLARKTARAVARSSEAPPPLVTRCPSA